MNNPFVIGRMVSEDESFRDRNYERQRVWDWLTLGTYDLCVMSGPRRIGKSSFLERLKCEVNGECQLSPAVSLSKDFRGHAIHVDFSEINLDSVDPIGTILDRIWSLLDKNCVKPDLGGGDTDQEARAIVHAASHLGRLVLLFDEVEILEAVSDAKQNAGLGASLVRELVDIFRSTDFGKADKPFLLLCWGRPLTTAPNRDEYLGRFKNTGFVGDLGLLDRDDIRDFHKGVPGYALSNAADELLESFTKGHPYYLSSLHAKLFARFEGRGTVTAAAVEESVLDAVREIWSGLNHAWLRSSALGPQASSIAWAIARLTLGSSMPLSLKPSERPLGFELSQAFSKAVSAREVVEFLKSEGVIVSDEEVDYFAKALRENLVLAKSADGRHKVLCPFLGFYLCMFDSWRPLLGDSELAFEHKKDLIQRLVDDDQYESAAVIASEISGAYEDAESVRLSIIAHENAGNFATALGQARKAQGDDDLKEAVPRILLRLLKARQRDGGDYWRQFRELANEYKQSEFYPLACEIVLRDQLDKWREIVFELPKIGFEDKDRARLILGRSRYVIELLEERDVGNWQQQVLKEYEDVLERHGSSPEHLLLAYSLIRECLLPATEREVHSRSVNISDDEFEKRVLHAEIAYGTRMDQQQRAKFRETLFVDERWWSATIDVVRRVWEENLDQDCEYLSHKELRNVIYRAPKRTKDALRDLSRKILPKRLCHLMGMRTRPYEEARIAIGLMLDEPSPDFEAITNSLAERALELGENASRQDLCSFCSETPDIYGFLLAEIARRNCELESGDLLDPLAYLFDAVFNQRLSDAPYNPVLAQCKNPEAWITLLEDPMLKSENVSISIVAKLRVELDAVARFYSIANPEFLPNDEELQHWLEPYHIFPLEGEWHRKEYKVRGLHNTNVIECFGAKRADGTRPDHFERCRIKIFKIDNRNETASQMLLALWEKERRVLSDISTRKTGRGLPRLVESFVVKDANTETLPDGNPAFRLLVIVTKGIYRETLREMIEKGPNRGNLLDMRNRARLWEEISGLVESVNALHQAGFLHRDIRPENIIVVRENNRQRLKLANFELSVYLNDLGTGSQFGRTGKDRYVAPEAVFDPDRTVQLPEGFATGENVASDVYSMGLVLFEVFIGRLTFNDLTNDLTDENGFHHYDIEKEIVSELKARVREYAKKSVFEDEHFSDEASEMLCRMISFDLVRYGGSQDDDREVRYPNLGEAVGICKKFASGFSAIQQLFEQSSLHLVSTCRPADQEKSIGRFLARYLGLPPARADSVIGSTMEDVVKFVQDDLREMKVFRNAETSRPLIIEGRKASYTVCPLESGNKLHQKVPFLQVIKHGDRKMGEALVSRGGKTSFQKPKLWNLQEAQQELAGGGLGDLYVNGSVWEKLFKKVSGYNDPLNATQRAMHAVVDLSIQVEQELWDRYLIPYQLIDYRPASDPNKRVDDEHDYVFIADRETDEVKTSLLGFVVQQVERHNVVFDLSERNSATSAFSRENIWNIIGPETLTADGYPDGSIVLMRKRSAQGDIPAPVGWLRPKSLEGSRRIRDRRRELSRRLEEDPFLLTTVTEPWRVQDNGFLQSSDLEFFDEHLDEDKKSVTERVLNERPLLTLQGPPGTGKTTLAVEVVMQQLLPSSPLAMTDSKNRRVLVTSQAHDPLNHLMKNVDLKLSGFVDDYLKTPDGQNLTRRQIKELRKKWETYKPVAVRIVPDRKLREDTSENAQLAHSFHCSTRSKKIIEEIQSSSWSDAGLSVEIFERWKNRVKEFATEGEIGSFESELAERLVRAANIIYVAANDRTISELPESVSFDLLVYEEAGKSIPAEILAPMRLARHWLLIGDHCQLPPFDIKNFVALMVEKSDQYLAQSAKVGLDANVRSIAKQLTGQVSQFFKYLHVYLNENTDSQYRYQYSLPRPATVSSQVKRSHTSDVLTYQWRMHPKISGMLRETGFYEFLEDGDTDPNCKKHRIVTLAVEEGRDIKRYNEISRHSLVWIDCPLSESCDDASERTAIGTEAWADRFALGGGFKNYYESKVIHRFFRYAQFSKQKPNRKSKDLFESIMVLSPYRAQVNLLKKNFEDIAINNHTKFANRVFTVDSAQGREAEIVVVSLVRNNPNVDPREAYGFLESLERLGVMFSRAEALLVVVGSSQHFRKDPDNRIGQASEYIERNGLWLRGSDLLPTWEVEKSNEKNQVRRARIDRDKSKFRRAAL